MAEARITAEAVRAARLTQGKGPLTGQEEEAERAAMAKAGDHFRRYIVQVCEDNAALVAEVDELREALGRIADGDMPGVEFAEDDLIQAFARAALSPESGGRSDG